ncbi:MAG: magnesium transporter [Thermoplasmatota archaeon]
MVSYDWKVIFKESAPILAMTAFIGVAGGQILNSINTLLVEIPILLFLLPVINAVGGNLGTVLGARISSGFHSGYIQPNLGDVEMRENILISSILGGCEYLFLALGVASSSLVLPLGIIAYQLFIIVLGAGILLTIFIIIITIIVSLLAVKKRLDPDNVLTPIVTTTGDFIGIGSLLFMIWLVIL